MRIFKRKFGPSLTKGIILCLILMVLNNLIYCQADMNERKEQYRDILGCWQEYIIHKDRKDKTAIRKIALNSEGQLTQSLVYEMATQCRIWLDDDEITFQEGHLEFWRGEFKGDMSKDKNSIPLVYKQMTNPFLLERIHDPEIIAMIDSLDASREGEYTYSIPPVTGDGWECADLEDVHIDKEVISDLVQQIRNGKYKDTHSLLIVKDHKLALEEYFTADGKINGPYARKIYKDRVQMLASVTKSVNSALIGIALDNGFINDVNIPVYEFFPEYEHLFNQEKKTIQLEHLLTMSAGFQWNELDIPYSDPQNDTKRMDNKHLMTYCLDKPMVDTPGEEFVYHTGLSIILGEILKRSTGMSVDVFAEKYLFGTLGISQFKWSKRANGWISTGGGLALRARDMAKFGQLYLNGGRWKGKQIVPEEWVTVSVQPHVQRKWGAYGYQWWLRSFRVNRRKVDCYYAIGNAGQFIIVFPEFRMIIVSTAQNYDTYWSQRFFKLVNDLILPAVMTSTEQS